MEEKNDIELKLSPPWIEFYRKVRAIFGPDPDVAIKFDNTEMVLKLYVNGQKKADAIATIMPNDVTVGGRKVCIEVIPHNTITSDPVNIFDIFQKAFKGNPILSYIKTSGEGPFKMNYVVFINKVVQYYNDDIGDVNRLESTLYEDLARDIFKKGLWVFFCTDVEDKSLEKSIAD